MNERSDFLLILLFLLACAWVAAAWFVLPQPLSLTLVLLAAFSIALPGVALLCWQLQLTRAKRREIALLASKAEAQVLESLTPLELDEAPPELQPMLQSLNRITARLREIFQHERDFSGHASHELRTPLSGIRLQAQLALRSEDEKDRVRALRHILRSVDRATHLVEQLLTLSRLAPMRVKEESVPVNLVRVTQFVMASLATKAEEKDIRLSMSEQARGRVMGQKDHLAVLISNLLRNAITYTQEGGFVRVDILPPPADEPDAMVHWLVTDNGPGIPEQDRERVLERFVKAPTTDQSGTGLGLAIVKRIVDLRRKKALARFRDSWWILPCQPPRTGRH
jgi:two-component system sensor histidine kinase QseC